MKIYPAITKKEFRELCELSSGPIEVGSAIGARSAAELFDAIKKSDRKKTDPEAAVINKVLLTARCLKKHDPARLSTEKAATAKTRPIPIRGHFKVGKKRAAPDKISRNKARRGRVLIIGTKKTSLV
jgi:hypothetical protein